MGTLIKLQREPVPEAITKFSAMHLKPGRKPLPPPKPEDETNKPEQKPKKIDWEKTAVHLRN